MNTLKKKRHDILKFPKHFCPYLYIKKLIDLRVFNTGLITEYLIYDRKPQSVIARNILYFIRLINQQGSQRVRWKVVRITRLNAFQKISSYLQQKI